MEATRRQRTLRAVTLMVLGIGGCLAIAWDVRAAFASTAFLLVTLAMLAWTIAENLALKQDEPQDYRGKLNTRLLQAGVLLAAFAGCFDLFHLPEGLLPRSAALAWLGAGVILLGATVRIWSIRTLADHFRYELRVEEKQRLVRAGPYRRIRHPSYLGLLLIALGAALSLSSVYAILAGAGMVLVVLVLRIREEERVLRASFGPEYDAYCDESWRMVPFVY